MRPTFGKSTIISLRNCRVDNKITRSSNLKTDFLVTFYSTAKRINRVLPLHPLVSFCYDESSFHKLFQGLCIQTEEDKSFASYSHCRILDHKLYKNQKKVIHIDHTLHAASTSF